MSVSEKKPINRQFERVSAEDVRRAAEYQAAILADVAGRRGTLHGRIKPLAPHMSVAGPAITVEVRPGDNLAIHAAMAVAQPEQRNRTICRAARADIDDERHQFEQHGRGQGGL